MIFHQNQAKIFFSFLTIFLKITFVFIFHRILMKKYHFSHFGQVSGGKWHIRPRVSPTSILSFPIDLSWFKLSTLLVLIRKCVNAAFQRRRDVSNDINCIANYKSRIVCWRFVWSLIVKVILGHWRPPDMNRIHWFEWHGIDQ